MKSAELKKDADMPEDVVRLNSTVQFKMPDMMCENFYSTNHLAYKEKVEKHFSQYRKLKKKLLTRINAATVSNK